MRSVRRQPIVTIGLPRGWLVNVVLAEMLMFRKKSGVKATIDSLIGASTRMDGNVVFHGGLRIDGHVRGDVLAAGETPGMLVIGEHARVDGDIGAAHPIVSGRVQGQVTLSGLVELEHQARPADAVR